MPLSFRMHYQAQSCVYAGYTRGISYSSAPLLHKEIQFNSTQEYWLHVSKIIQCLSLFPDGSCPSWSILTRTQMTEKGHRKHLKVSEKLEGRGGG